VLGGAVAKPHLKVDVTEVVSCLVQQRAEQRDLLSIHIGLSGSALYAAAPSSTPARRLSAFARAIG
jgi:predicted flavoprotein YhiN